MMKNKILWVFIFLMIIIMGCYILFRYNNSLRNTLYEQGEMLDSVMEVTY